MNINKILQNIDYVGLINLIERDDRLSHIFNDNIRTTANSKYE